MTSTNVDRINGARSSLAIKAPCVLKTTGNVTLSAEQTIDGTLTSSSRVLVGSQTDGTENGIYVTDSGAWTRSPDFDGNNDITGGTQILVTGGTAGTNTYWRVSNTTAITIGTTAITFEQGSFGDAATLNFLQTGTGAVTRTVQSKERDIVSVIDFGAVGDNSTDDTAAIQAAIDAVPSTGGGVYFPAGQYKVTSSISASPVNAVILYGDGVGATQIRSTVAGSATILAGDHVGSATRTFTIRDLAIQYDGAVPPVSGTIGIHAKNVVAPSFFNTFSIQKFYDGLVLDATTAQGNIMITDFIIGNIERYGIQVTNQTQGIWICRGKIYARDDTGPVTSSIAIYINDSNGVYLSTIDLILNDRGLVVSPGAGETVHWLFTENLIVDSNTAAGIDIVPTGGTVYGLQFNGVWSSSNGTGIKLRGSAASSVDGIVINGGTMLNNDNEGIILTGGPTTFKGIHISSCQIVSNNQSQTGLPGINVAAGISDFSIQDCKIGAIASHVNYQAYGVSVLVGASDNYHITNNNVTGNVTGGLNENGTGVNKVVKNNVGHVPVPFTRVSNIPIGAVAFGSLGTSAVHVAGTIYVAEINITEARTITGIAVLQGVTVGTDKLIVALYDKSGGVVLATSDLAGTTTSGADAFQQIAFTATLTIMTPGRYWVAIQCNGTTDTTRRIAANTYLNLTKSYVGSFGTMADLLVPSTTTADVGPIAYIY